MPRPAGLLRVLTLLILRATCRTFLREACRNQKSQGPLFPVCAGSDRAGSCGSTSHDCFLHHGSYIHLSRLKILFSVLWRTVCYSLQYMYLLSRERSFFCGGGGGHLRQRATTLIFPEVVGLQLELPEPAALHLFDYVSF